MSVTAVTAPHPHTGAGASRPPADATRRPSSGAGVRRPPGGLRCGPATRRDDRRPLPGGHRGPMPDGPPERPALLNATRGAELLRIGTARFARLARAGCFDPVDLRPSRYRVIIWLYPPDELRAFAERSPELLTGPAPDRLRTRLRRGTDLRPVRWRHRRTARLAHRAADPWSRAAALCAVLDPPDVAAEVPDRHERDLLQRLRPRLIDIPLTAEQRALVAPLLTAADPDEARVYRDALRAALRTARSVVPLPGAAVTAARRP
ncbi:DUF6397 family protein [Streptomyces marincola]|uniref:DUF6397 family protein n=1 Tax=Streptomyces marincola TaxID=2878388 RepID=UPI001CF3E117|nr:DUF6397 family protein [Streptomyces marincola]UCM91579.1 DUF6397 family protein [Streptomyces marincola]